VSKYDAEIREAFRGAALRPTAQRFAVLEYLARHPVHATAGEICRAVNRAHPRASRATVYNNLRDLARSGLVREVACEGRASRFDSSLRRHHHFVCEKCGAIEDIAWFDLPPAAGKAMPKGRTVRGYEIVFRGSCESCGP
jgi:Fur family transcriptional regulator, peroxide stress response regulator